MTTKKYFENRTEHERQWNHTHEEQTGSYRLKHSQNQEVQLEMSKNLYEDICDGAHEARNQQTLHFLALG